MIGQQYNEFGPLDGKYSLKLGDRKNVEPEVFLELFKKEHTYEDVRKFVRRVDNDTGIPYLTLEEYEKAERVLPADVINYLQGRLICIHADKAYLRGSDYYLNYNPHLEKVNKESIASIALILVRNSVEKDLLLAPLIKEGAEKSRCLEDRMLVGSLMELYKNHLMVAFTGLYESMKVDDTIELKHYRLIRSEVENIINDYYKFIIVGKMPSSYVSFNKLRPIFTDIERAIHLAEKKKLELQDRGEDLNQVPGIYDGKRYLTREFDHPGRMILYASHLLSQVKKKGKKYDLLVNILNGSIEMGIATQTIDKILGTKSIIGTTIFEVDFAKYSRIDRGDKDISSYSELESIAIPKQLRTKFRQEVENRNVLVMDDNLNTGKSLYNIKVGLDEIAKSVDISTAEIVALRRVIELIYEKDPKTDIHQEIKFLESNLTYPPIGWWRDQIEMLKENRILKIIQLIQH